MEIEFDDDNQVISTLVDYNLPQNCVDVLNYTTQAEYDMLIGYECPTIPMQLQGQTGDDFVKVHKYFQYAVQPCSVVNEIKESKNEGTILDCKYQDDIAAFSGATYGITVANKRMYKYLSPTYGEVAQTHMAAMFSNTTVVGTFSQVKRYFI